MYQNISETICELYQSPCFLLWYLYISQYTSDSILKFNNLTLIAIVFLFVNNYKKIMVNKFLGKEF